MLQWVLAAIVGGILSYAVWGDLLTGSGLIGGDIYAYFLPQKLILADAFANGELPLWHRLTGLGYPLLAESQAGVFYPPNQILYRILDVEQAFHWFIVAHYALAFLFSWRFARCQHLSNSSSLLAALIFVYGWFPARISHEWSIVAGLWFPLCLWITDGLLRRPSGWRFFFLAVCVAMHLLAGHFTLAFVSQLTIVGYAFLHLVRREGRPALPAVRILFPVLAVFAGLVCAAVQLVPTYELKLASQRHGESQKFDPAFGHLPPLYLTQLVASWTYWHTPEVIQSSEFRTTPGAVQADTNHVEAHFYWGLLPFVLVVVSCMRPVRKKFPPGVHTVWFVLSLLSVVYATGWLMPLARHLPGFGFFNGPGRYTMVAALGGGIMAGLALDVITRRWSHGWVVITVLGLGTVNLWDTLLASRYVADAIVVPASPIRRLDDSWVRQRFMNAELLQSRLLAPGPNIGNFFGVSCVPQYLGLGPAVYYSELLNPDTGAGDADSPFPSQKSIENLRFLGVSHILTTEPIPNLHESVELEDSYPDAVLNTVWGRGLAPCWLYSMKDSPGLIVAEPPANLVDFEVVSVSTNVVEFVVTLSETADVSLKELMYPGWSAQVDGQPVPVSGNNEEFFRTINLPAGTHRVRWEFRPFSLKLGFWISVIGLIATLIGAWLVPRHQNSDSQHDVRHA